MTKEKKIDALQKAIAFIRSDKFNPQLTSGLCGVVIQLDFNNKITKAQVKFLENCIKTIPRRTYKDGAYAWKQGSKAPRIRFLNEQIKELGTQWKKKKKSGSKK